MCTHPQQRGTGLMRRMLAVMLHTLSVNGYDITILLGGEIPAKLGCVPAGRTQGNPTGAVSSPIGGGLGWGSFVRQPGVIVGRVSIPAVRSRVASVPGWSRADPGESHKGYSLTQWEGLGCRSFVRQLGVIVGRVSIPAVRSRAASVPGWSLADPGESHRGCSLPAGGGQGWGK